MKTKTLASYTDIVDSIKLIKSDKYNVMKDGVIIHETDDMSDAQRVSHAHHGVISGKGTIYFFQTHSIETDR